MKYITWIGSQIYRFTFNLFFTVCGRGFWYIKLFLLGPKNWKETTKKMKSILNEIETFDELKAFYEDFQWIKDGLFNCECVLNRWPTWKASIRIIFHRGLRGNCDDAELLSAWLVDNFKKEHCEYKKNIYVPVYPNNYDKAHYFASVKNKGIEYQFSSGSASVESADNLAVRYLGEKIKYIWLS